MLFAVTSIRPVGCTFFDWSLYYLSGQTQFYSIKKKQWLPIVNNPFDGLNAHGHLKNHPRGFDSTNTYIDQLLQCQGNVSFYPTGLSLLESSKYLNLNFPNLEKESDLQSILGYINQDYGKALDYSIDVGTKLIYLDITPDLDLCFIVPRTKDSIITKLPDGTLHEINDIQTEYQKFFFSKSMEQWENLGLTNRWDERERMALCTRPFNLNLYRFRSDKQHLKFNCKTWWTDTERVLLMALDFLQLTIDQSKLDSWRDIHREWQKSQLDSMNFAFNCKDIVDSIVNGHWMDIDLTFEQEVVVQHCLIYQHNLNLKTWKLDKFPSNTIALHNLLEPNIHQVPKIY